MLAGAVWSAGRLSASYGHEMVYYLATPGWARRLWEPPPVTFPDDFSAAGGEGPMLLAAGPHLTVHQLLTREECVYFTRYVNATMLPPEAYPHANDLARTAPWPLSDVVWYATMAIYRCMRTSSGAFLPLRMDSDGGVDAGLRSIWRKLLRNVALATGRDDLDAFEAPFYQAYGVGDRFGAHYDMYALDAGDPWDAERNVRSMTVLMYLDDVPEGGETEFLLTRPAVVRVRPAAGRAIVWSNCVLEDEAARGERPAGERPRCVARERESMHQALPPRSGRKRTLSFWIHQRPVRRRVHGTARHKNLTPNNINTLQDDEAPRPRSPRRGDGRARRWQ